MKSKKKSSSKHGLICVYLGSLINIQFWVSVLFLNTKYIESKMSTQLIVLCFAIFLYDQDGVPNSRTFLLSECFPSLLVIGL